MSARTNFHPPESEIFTQRKQEAGERGFFCFLMTPSHNKTRTINRKTHKNPKNQINKREKGTENKGKVMF